MCAVATLNPTALPLLLALISIFCEGNLTSEALPLRRRSVDEGPLHGFEFLSVFIDSSKAPSSSPATSTERRIPRSTLHLSSYPERKVHPTVGNLFKIDRGNRLTTSDNKMSDGIVLAVRVSSSVGRTLINKNDQKIELEQGKNTIDEFQWTSTSTISTLSKDYSGDKTQLVNDVDQISVGSEDHPIIAESNKNEFSIEEKEPITTSDVGSARPFEHLTLPDFNPPQHLLQDGQSHSKIHPYQQTVIYHNTNNQARSVSYSTVVQNLEQKQWEEEKPKTHERQERNYDSSKTVNNFENNEKNEYERTTSTSTTPYPWVSTTSKLEEVDWEERKTPAPTQSYAHPEQNYEVDESVSVVTNGKAHGVQTKQIDAKNKKDDNQKVGYVVEGRNYRKYRVEERTPDGFIVGEYGVVSHDDGSLRGVRYTADGTINPRLIYDALMKFLSL